MAHRAIALAAIVCDGAGLFRSLCKVIMVLRLGWLVKYQQALGIANTPGG
ncbi:hypothetical protein DSUL_50186 [Desulfovibrionales bacterium]